MTRAALRPTMREERGFSLVVVMLMMLAVSAIFVAAYAVAQGDIRPTSADRDRKQAYAAAQSGVDYYLFHLAQDNAYWTSCSNVPAPGPGQVNPVNEVWSGQGADPRRWRSVPGSTSQYTIELLPAPGHASCTTTNAQASMIDPATQTFQIRSTGRMNGIKRSVVASFRRKTFLDFLYFTNYETVDPVAYQTQSLDEQQQLAQSCSRYRRAGRTSPPCSDIVFVTGDHVNGPFHTNDEIRACGTPVFGRAAADPVEVSAPAPGWSASSCGGTPSFLGTFRAAAPILALPQSNSSLKSLTAAQYLFTGTTTIVMSGSTMTVTNAARALTNAPMTLPTNGVIYVQNGVCGTAYDLTQDYNNPAGCADLHIQGSYAQSLTIAAENDIVVRGNLTHSGNALLGLIPNNFARIYHPVTNRSGLSCTNSSSTPTNITVDAAILTLTHSLIVDNYFCGSSLGTLTVNGAIAQNFRGPVGTGGGTGYIKSYNFDERLLYTNPPYFLAPVQAPWDLMRFTEQVPPQ